MLVMQGEVTAAAVLWAIDGCRDLDIKKSTLIGNAEWKSLGDNAR